MITGLEYFNVGYSFGEISMFNPFPVFFAVILSFAITRNTKRVSQLMFPMGAALWSTGLQTGYLFLVSTALVWVIQTFSMTSIGSFLEVSSEARQVTLSGAGKAAKFASRQTLGRVSERLEENKQMKKEARLHKKGESLRKQRFLEQTDNDALKRTQSFAASRIEDNIKARDRRRTNIALNRKYEDADRREAAIKRSIKLEDQRALLRGRREFKNINLQSDKQAELTAALSLLTPQAKYDAGRQYEKGLELDRLAGILPPDEINRKEEEEQ